MAYDPATALDFNSTCYYSPPPGNCLEIRLGDFPQVCAFFRPQHGGSISFDLAGSAPRSLDFSFAPICCPTEQNPAKCEEVRPYSAQVGNVDFDFYKLYDWPSGTVNFDLADCFGDDPPEPPPEPPPWYVIPSEKSPGTRCGFGDGRNIEPKKSTGWADSRYVEPETRARYAKTIDVEKIVASAWSGLLALYQTNRVAFDRLLRTDSSIASLWANLHGNDNSGHRLAFDRLDEQEKTVVAPYRYPPTKDINVDAEFEETERSQTDKTDVEIPWGSPPAKDRHHTTRWGKKWYEEICIRDYEYPVGTVDFNLDTEIINVGDKDHVDFWFESLSYDLRCNHREPSGWRDPYTYEPPIIYPQTPRRRTHLHMNSALLKRVTDNMPLNMGDFTAKMDFGSWVWEFSADIKDQASFDAVAPDENGYQEVEASINGYLFRFLVEKAASANERKNSFSIGGRGLAAELAAPYAPKTSYTAETAINVRQIIEERLTNTGWTVDWQITDFLVPADVYSFINSTPMEAIIEIVAQVGARVQAHRIDKVLQIVPRYTKKPWNWPGETPDLGINESMILSATGDWQPGPNYNGVVVSGTDAGVICKVMRTGSGGTKLAPMVTDPLIVTTEAATMRGIYELAQAGNWRPGVFELPLEPAPDLPGLLLPGSLLQAIRKNESYRCQVTGTTITAKRQRGLKIRQAIEVERYHGESVA